MNSSEYYLYSIKISLMLKSSIYPVLLFSLLFFSCKNEDEKKESQINENQQTQKQTSAEIHKVNPEDLSIKLPRATSSIYPLDPS